MRHINGSNGYRLGENDLSVKADVLKLQFFSGTAKLSPHIKLFVNNH